MATITANYASMASGHQGLVATWQRIEGHLADLDAAVGATGDMKAAALSSYQALKARWALSASDRQLTLRALGDLVEHARTHYQQVDAALAAQFAG